MSRPLKIMAVSSGKFSQWNHRVASLCFSSSIFNGTRFNLSVNYRDARARLAVEQSRRVKKRYGTHGTT